MKFSSHVAERTLTQEEFLAHLETFELTSGHNKLDGNSSKSQKSLTSTRGSTDLCPYEKAQEDLRRLSMHFDLLA